MVDVLGARVVGPLEPYAVGFAGELVRQGYSVSGASQQLSVFAHLSRWLTARRWGMAELSPETIERFMRERRERGYRNCRSSRAMVPLLDYLRRLGLVADRPAVAVSASGVLLRDFRTYLTVERGMSAAGIDGYVQQVAGFVERCVGDGGEMGGVTAGAVTAFMVAESRRLSPKTLQRVASAMRSLLRFWYVRGLITTSLVEAVPKVACRDPGPARGPAPDQVAAMLESCERGRPGGVRDFAILTLLSRVGLRSGEVAGLRLDDIDWRSGEIVVTGKGERRDRLPLPCDVGEAIVDYLQRGRPPDALDRRLFIKLKAPHRGLSRSAVSAVVATAARRAGVGTVRAHRLRHSAATSMLAAGASLTEIGQVLRHRASSTTSIYAKVDIDALRTLARPWPTGGAS